MAEITNPNLRLAIYARVSTEEQREGQNIDSQISELERFSREKGWLIAGTYKDEGWSGGVMERPELDRLRDDAQKGVFEAVLINDVDRLARDVAHLGVIKRDLERKGIKVIFRKLPSDTSPTSNLMVNILGSFAEFERELIADRTRRGRRHKVEVKKLYLGSNTAYGYRYVHKDYGSGKEGYLEIVPSEAAVVSQMFEWVDQEGLSARRVLNRLNQLSIPPRNGAPSWAKSSVLRILKNEMYAGVWHYNKFQGCEPKTQAISPRYRKRTKSSVRQRPKLEWIPLKLPPMLQIIPHDRWERIQQQLARNLTFSPRNEKHSYLLKGLVRCGGCGARYVGDPGHGQYSYRCIARCKKIAMISERVLNEVVKQAVTKIILNPELILEPLHLLDTLEAAEQKRAKRGGAAIAQESKRLHAEEQRVLDAYRLGILNPRQLTEQLEKLKSTRAALDLQRTEFEKQAAVSPEQIETGVRDYCAEVAKHLTEFTAERWSDFLRLIIQTVTFYGDSIRIRGRIAALDAQPAGAEIQLEAPVTSQPLRKAPRTTAVLNK